jgi:hypothetical protein
MKMFIILVPLCVLVAGKYVHMLHLFLFLLLLFFAITEVMSCIPSLGYILRCFLQLLLLLFCWIFLLPLLSLPTTRDAQPSA